MIGRRKVFPRFFAVYRRIAAWFAVLLLSAALAVVVYYLVKEGILLRIAVGAL